MDKLNLQDMQAALTKIAPGPGSTCCERQEIREIFGMSSVPAESVALHLVRHLVRGLGKTEGQGIAIQSLRHWWTVSLGQRGDDLELGLEYASNHHWLERRPDNVIVLTSQGSEKGVVTH